MCECYGHARVLPQIFRRGRRLQPRPCEFFAAIVPCRRLLPSAPLESRPARHLRIDKSDRYALTRLRRVVPSVAYYCRVVVLRHLCFIFCSLLAIAIPGVALQEILHDQALLGTFLKRQIIAKAEPAIRRRLEAAMDVAATHQGDGLLDAMLLALDMPGLASHRWVERQRCADAVAHLEGLQQAALIFNSAADFFRHVNALELSYEALRAGKAQKTSLILSDIPSVKGLEFERVIIPFIERGEFPADNGGTLDDERNLMYVAMTRCSHSLTLMFSQKRPSAFEEAMLFASR